VLASAAVALWAQSAAAVESRSYVTGWFSQANYSQDGDCPGGVNPDVGQQYPKNLAVLGKSKAEIDHLMRAWQEGGIEAGELTDLMNNRGRIDGKPVNAYAHPEAVVDPKFKTVTSKYAYGFDLDGKQTAEDFQEPETKQAGIDNQLFRALGCIQPFRGTMANRPTYWTWSWTMMKDSMPAWLITLTGDDLDRDGDVTITFDRAMEHQQFNSNGEPRAHVTFRADSDPRSHHVFAGQIKDGVISITKPANLRLLKDPLSYPELNLANAHLRLKVKPDGSLDGILAGYQPWREIYFAFAQGGFNAETSITGDLVGIYYLLKRTADGDPDPSSGQNRSISVSYRVEAVPAFVVQPSTEQKNVSARRN
jgi:hypothetical protein